MVMAGKRAFIDSRYRTRSFLERKLIEVMEQCWAHRRIDRIHIFDVVKLLREAELNATLIRKR